MNPMGNPPLWNAKCGWVGFDTRPCACARVTSPALAATVTGAEMAGTPARERDTLILHATVTRAAWLCALLLCASACGGSGASVVKPGEFNAQHALLFDDGVDLIEDPSGLSGRWRDDWESELGQRLELADVVASGTVSTVREEIDPEGHASYHVLFRVHKAFKGKPRGSEIILGSHEGASGFASIEQHREHMVDRNMIVFVRYAAGTDTSLSAVTPHFHMMPPSDAVARALQRYDARQNPHRIQVIEHKQD
jgi:hypothetical protein